MAGEQIDGPHGCGGSLWPTFKVSTSLETIKVYSGVIPKRRLCIENLLVFLLSFFFYNTSPSKNTVHGKSHRLVLDTLDWLERYNRGELTEEERSPKELEATPSEWLSTDSTRRAESWGLLEPKKGA